MSDPVLALDLGGTKIRAALVTGAGIDGGTRVSSTPRVERVATVATPAAEGAAAILDAALELAEQVRGGAVIRAVGISSAGVIDTARGAVTHATDALIGWAGTAIAPVVLERFAVPVSVLNDVHAHGLGEARFGVGHGRASLLLVAVGTGIGGCQVLDGSPVLGSRGAAGHIGHLAAPGAEGVPCPCGRTGHLEGLASGPGIVRLARRLGADPALADGHALARAARDGDRTACEAYRIAGVATGRTVGGLLNVLDAEVVALTGGVSEAESLWRDAVSEGIAHDAMDVVADTPVLAARAGNHAALLGAAARAEDALRAS
ncbi:MAG: ROK family protein [Brachybacterium sp.]|uniref:ROK family protein n=1 Tax=Brachybacterium sp. TaxID=1891286 RepID=UPI002649C1CB|nr:ROK family protein [Brachybacterium sp.]MDN5688833.1 ROK family protein [Brachybacterium sp.]